ncbi:MAG: hypothetical protein C0490_17340, partial [Marivirga sp.]|nr:hypothetical protein [Marivirga sp.]
ATSIINAPIEKIDLTNWLFTLKDSEYQACSKAHIAGGTSLSNTGKRMSLNVERIAGNLLVQHYVEDVSKKDHCRVKSISDSFSAMGDTRLGIMWELKVKKLSETSCELSNHVVVLYTDEFRVLLNKANILDLTSVKNSMSANVSAHNQEETPNFAQDIENKALAGVWD